MSKSNLVLVLMLMTSSWKVVDSLRCKIETGNNKCMTEDLKSSTMSVGKYSVVNPNEGYPFPDDYMITAKVLSPQGDIYHHEVLVHSGNFSFTAHQEGHYLVCFYTTVRDPPRTVEIDFDWRIGVAAKDWPNIAKRGQLNIMQLELKKMNDTITSISSEMFHHLAREEKMQEMNRSTTSTMINFGYLSLVICLSVAALQFWHLKTYFRRKKLL